MSEALRVSLVAACIERHQAHVQQYTRAVRRCRGAFDRQAHRRAIERSKRAIERWDRMLASRDER